MKTFSFISALLSLIICLSCSKKNSKAGYGNNAPPFPVLAVDTGSYEIQKIYPAVFRGLVNTAVMAKNIGYIDKILIDEGQEVKKGTPLYRIETFVLDQNANEARAQVEAASLEVEKLEPLYKRGIVSIYELKNAIANLEKAESALNSILANIE